MTEHIREITDEKTGKTKPALDYTGSNLYDHVGKLMGKPSQKKGRKLVPWTPAEYHKLRSLVKGKTSGEVDWKAVAEQFTGRTQWALEQRAYARNFVLRKVLHRTKHKKTKKKSAKHFPTRQRKHRIGVSCPNCGDSIVAVFVNSGSGSRKIEGVNYCQKCDQLYKVSLQAMELE
jgi:hypothetical protein